MPAAYVSIKSAVMGRRYNEALATARRSWPHLPIEARGQFDLWPCELEKLLTRGSGKTQIN